MLQEAEGIAKEVEELEKEIQIAESPKGKKNLSPKERRKRKAAARSW